MSTPSGYEDAGEAVALEDVSAFADPADYEYAKPPPKQLQHRGVPRMCKVCYRSHPTFIDTVCPGCIRTLHLLNNLRVEIGNTVDAVMRMPLPEVFGTLWDGYKRLKKKLNERR